MSKNQDISIVNRLATSLGVSRSTIRQYPDVIELQKLCNQATEIVNNLPIYMFTTNGKLVMKHENKCVAARWLCDNEYIDGKNKISAAKIIIKSILGFKLTAYGYRWSYSETLPPLDDSTTRWNQIYRFSIKGELLQTYDNKQEAIKWMREENITAQEIRYSLHHASIGGFKPIHGYIWSYDSKLTGFKYKPIYRFSMDGELLQTYNNRKEAMEWAVGKGHVDIKTGLSQVLSKTTDSFIGYMWSYDNSPSKSSTYGNSKIYMFSMDGELLKIHHDYIHVIKWLVDNNITNKHHTSIRALIFRAAIGHANNMWGYRWSLTEIPNKINIYEKPKRKSRAKRKSDSGK